MECPGGASGTSQTIFDELKALKKSHPKPVVVLIENICASGGYNIACAADYIIAPGSAIVGSIGASMPYLFNVKELLEKFNIKYTPIKAGSYKNVTNPFVDLSEQEKSLLQNVADDSYEQFVLEVSDNRKLSHETSKDWADGKIFTGKQAKSLGLIDEIGSLENAIQALKRLGGFKDNIEWIHPPRKFSFLSFFSGDTGQDQDSSLFASMAYSLSNFVSHFLPA
jgi:protease-4